MIKLRVAFAVALWSAAAPAVGERQHLGRRQTRDHLSREPEKGASLYKEARAAGISLAPGPLFSPDGGFRNFIRINCGYPWSPRMERAVAVLGHLVRRLTKK